jgi:hypothetical protein
MNDEDVKRSQSRISHMQKLNEGSSQHQSYCRSIGRVSKLLNKQSSSGNSQSFQSKDKSQCSSASTANTMMITDFKRDDRLNSKMTTRNA